MAPSEKQKLSKYDEFFHSLLRNLAESDEDAVTALLASWIGVDVAGQTGGGQVIAKLIESLSDRSNHDALTEVLKALAENNSQWVKNIVSDGEAESIIDDLVSCLDEEPGDTFEELTITILAQKPQLALKSLRNSNMEEYELWNVLESLIIELDP